jgi:hypothetical protein
VDPLEELNAQFKEMRALLDDMDARIGKADEGNEESNRAILG